MKKALCFTLKALLVLYVSAGSAMAESSLKNLLQGKFVPINYEANDPDKTLIDSLKANRGYVAIDVDIANLAMGEMSCKDNSFFKFLKDIFVSDNATYLLEVTFQINNRTLSSIPLVIISDVKGQCKTIAYQGKNRVTPWVRLGPDAKINLTYTIKHTSNTDINLKRAISLVGDILQVTGVQSIAMAKLLEPAIQEKVKSLEAELGALTNAGQDDTVLASFDFKAAKGIGLPTQAGGLKINFTISPRRSLFASEFRTVGTDTLPAFSGAPNSLLLEPIHPTNFPNIYENLENHFAKDNTARSRFSGLSNADDNSFADACANVVSELYDFDGLGLDEFDTAASLRALLLKISKHRSGKTLEDNECQDQGNYLTLIRSLGLSFAEAKEPPSVRRAKLERIDPLLDTLATVLKSDNADAKKSYIDQKLLGTSVDYLDVDKVVDQTIGYTSERAVVLAKLASMTGRMGCYFSPRNEAVVSRTVLLATDGQPAKKKVFAVFVFDNPSSESLRVKHIELFDWDAPKNRARAKQLLGLIRADTPSDACQGLLDDVFKE